MLMHCTGQSQRHSFGKEIGEIPERSNGADCKSVGDAFGGSNPPLPTSSHKRLTTSLLGKKWTVKEQKVDSNGH